MGYLRGVAPARSAALVLLALAACAGPGRAGRDPFAGGDLPDRLASRAASLVGHSGRFEVGGARLNADCSGFVEAVYMAEGVPLVRLVAAAAPAERSGVAGLFRAMERYGTVFGGGGAWPAPGDLVFFHDTYDRNRNAARDDRFTHVGVVERVEHGTVVFLHRGGREVVRGVLTPDRPLEPADGDRVLNTALREKARRARDGERETTLAGALFAGYARLDPRRIPAELLRGR